MNTKKIIKLFEQGNVCVCGLRGQGKDLLMANVVCRRQLPYISNMDYGGVRYELDFRLLDCGQNTYANFITGDLSYYDFIYPDETDIYITDAGVYLPAHFCNNLNRDFPYFATFMALSRHLGDCNVHFNVQQLNRCWDKVREQSDLYIMCKGVCKWFLRLTGIVIQRVVLYEKYQSAVDRVPPFRLPKPFFSFERRYQWKIEKQHYEVSYGSITPLLLIYRNRSNYNSRIFKEMLLNGKKTKN